MRSEPRLRQLLGRLGSGARAWRAPGRVNLIGEHTDYTGGLALPFACDREVVLATVPEQGRIVLESLDEPGRVDVPLGAAEPPDGWGRYPWGVQSALRESGHKVRGFRGVLSSDVPVGAGLSSSAALEAAVALALTGGEPVPATVLQRAEHIAVGVPCGVMDQVATLHGRAGHAILLDCAAVEWEHVPVGTAAAFVVIDTGTRRSLVDGRYAARREEAEAAVVAARTRIGEGDPRRLVPADADRSRLPEPLGRRLRHLVTENARVLLAAQALRSGDGPALGVLLSASHASLRDDFEVSAPVLDEAVAAAESAGAYGARLVGAGFAGCVLAAVAPDALDGFLREMAHRLPSAEAFTVRPVDGAGEMPVGQS